MDFPFLHFRLTVRNSILAHRCRLAYATSGMWEVPFIVIYRLVGALLLEQNDEWALQRRYMTLETLAEVGDNPNISLSAVTV